MAGFKVEVPHGMEVTTVVTRLKGFSERVRADYQGEITDVVEQWVSERNLEFSFRAMGFKIAGSALVDESHVRLNGTLPLAAAMFRGTIERQIREKLEEAIRDDS
ncbi:MAG: polyhydroxyalkanoic acid system family protein [Pirellulaceae bacterium]|nr:polyhydroxyalkanoic acid system family protein [Planctomycetales bacterium]